MFDGNPSVQQAVRTQAVEEWTSAALARLSADRTNPLAWAAFLRDSFGRWLEDGRQMPALRRSLRIWLLVCSGTTLLAHALASGRRPDKASLAWALATSLMADWHLGMIPSPTDPSPTRLGLPNRLTLLRAFLPAALMGRIKGRKAQRLRTAVALSALISDFVDGYVAKRTNARTHFGSVADPLADAAVWITLATTGPRSRYRRRIAWLTSTRHGAPVLLGLLVTFSRGRTYDWRSNKLGRWSSALLAILLALREV